MNNVIGKFIPIGCSFRHRQEFNVLTKEHSDYLGPSWIGIKEDGDEYHVTESYWKFEPYAWSGQGLPPVGLEVEISYAGNEWGSCSVIAYGEEQIIFKYTSGREFSGHRNNYRFRPIRSPEYVARDEAKAVIAELCRQSASNGHSADLIYHAIAAGKIPGVKLEEIHD